MTTYLGAYKQHTLDMMGIKKEKEEEEEEGE